MRWPFRRKGTISVPEPAAKSGGSPAAPDVSARRPAREWATLPPLPIMVASAAPLVIGSAPVLPPLPGRRSVSVTPVVPPAGRVEGLATVLPPRPEPSTMDPTPAARPLPAPSVVHRPARPLPAEVPSLTDAVDEYVGEPREPAEPYRAPGWLRFTPQWLEQSGAPDLASLAGMPSLPATPTPTVSGPPLTVPSFIPDEVTSQPPAPLPPPIQEVAAVPPVPEPMVLKRKRASLADSRRLGLGAPISRAPGEPFVLPSQELVLPPAIEAARPDPAPPEPEPPAPQPEPEPVAEEPPPPPPAPEPPPPPVTPPSATETSEPAPAPRRVVAPTYRATPSTQPAQGRKPLPRAVVVTRPPAELVDALRATQRADVADVPVYRGPKVSKVARDRGARAFAARGAVFLPDEAGPVDSPATRGLLAHELVHAVQQRTLGPNLPSPSSPEGQALEAEAHAAERYYGGEAGASAPAPLIHAPRPAVAAPAEVSEVDISVPAQLAPLAPAPHETHSSSSTLHTPFDESTRQAVGQIAETSAKKVVEEWTNPALGGHGFTQPKGSGGHGSGGHGSGGQGSGGQGSGSHGSGGSKGPTGTQAATTAPAFDADAETQRRIEERLEQVNAERAETGQEPLLDLTESEKESIARTVHAEAGRHGGGTGGTAAPGGTAAATKEKPGPKANSAAAWMQALTGRTEDDGGLSFKGAFIEPGKEGSWFDSKVSKEERAPDQVLADIGIGSHDMKASLDPDNWFNQTDEHTPTVDGDAGKGGPRSVAAAAETQAHGRSSTEEHPMSVDKLDLDELSQRLYDRLRSKLRLELLVDRERSGRLTDFR